MRWRADVGCALVFLAAAPLHRSAARNRPFRGSVMRRTTRRAWRGSATTDSVALFRKLDELKAAETAYIEQVGMLSTCEMRLPPAITVQGGRCTASR